MRKSDSSCMSKSITKWLDQPKGVREYMYSKALWNIGNVKKQTFKLASQLCSKLSVHLPHTTSTKSSWSQFTLAVESRGEGGVVQSSLRCSLSTVWSHSGYAVFSLFWRQLTTKFIGSDVRLGRERERERFLKQSQRSFSSTSLKA